MEIIEKAFYRAYSKRSKSILMLLIPVIFMAAAQVAMFTDADMLLGFFTVICIVVLLIARRFLLFRKSYVRKKISNALHKETQSDLFFSSIEAEMRSPDLQTYTVDRKRISIFVTKNWLILVSPNGCLISILRDIKNISVVFKETKSRFRLKVDFFSGSSFSCKYECLYEPLVELINKSKGVVS